MKKLEECSNCKSFDFLRKNCACSCHKLHKKVNMKNVVWGCKNIGGGNLDILRKIKNPKIPAICDKHQEIFQEMIECNDCDIRINY
jgi:hypothetical protein